ncbi:TPA: hypothetical protein RQN15_002196 [Aeromonas hydrophila]|nr:hypothetical protein [Aeromonas hydrophila]
MILARGYFKSGSHSNFYCYVADDVTALIDDAKSQLESLSGEKWEHVIQFQTEFLNTREQRKSMRDGYCAATMFNRYKDQIAFVN